MEFKGKIIIKKVNEDGSFERIEGENNFTTLLKNLIMTKGIGSLFSSFSQSLGTTRTWTGKRLMLDNKLTSDGISAMRIYLLNDQNDVINVNSRFIPIFNNDGTINYNIVVGYADFSYAGDKNKQGVLAMPDGDAALLPNNISVGFHWPVGKLAGSFNKIAICVNPELSGTIYQSKTIDEFIPAIGENNSSGNASLPLALNSDKSFLGADEILVGSSESPSKARKKINIITGAITELDASNKWYNYSLSDLTTYISKYRLHSGKVVSVSKSSSSMNFNIYNSDGTSDFSGSKAGRGVFVNTTSGKAYVLEPASSNCVIKVYDCENSMTEISGEAITIPTASLRNNTSMNYSLLYLQQLGETEATIIEEVGGRYADTNNCKNLVFNDIKNPLGSIIGTTNIRPSSYISVPVSTTTGTVNRHFLFFAGNSLCSDGGIPRVISPANSLVSKSNFGVEIVDLDNWFGNLLTVFTPATAQVLTAVNSLDITYTFSFN